jgi:CspA family cold shock protein
VSNGLRKGRYPDREFGSKVAQALRKVADQLEG